MARVADFTVIPSIEQLRQRPAVASLERDHGHAATVRALRRAADAVRAAIASGERVGSSEEAALAIEARAHALLHEEARGSLRPVINATGVVLHTNLGRAPLSEAALERLHAIARGYSNLEYDVDEGARGSRHVHAERLLTALTGAEAAAVVNNNAAAALLILAALAAGREVIISRGELVEIGGGFRVPDVMAQSGAVLREVGTTNRTRVADYRAAITSRTAMLLRVHPSNFRMEGFTERPRLDELAALARETQIPLVEDLGSGRIAEEIEWEPSVQASLAAGADLVCFSGDKLLGGPQCGIIAGRAPLVRALQRHPLMRALRVDKLTLAALEGTLLEYRARRAASSVPIVRMLTLPPEVLEARAERLAAQLRDAGWDATTWSGASAVGGGSAPGVELPTTLVALAHPEWSAGALDRRLRALDPPVIARIHNDRVVLDPRTILEQHEPALLSQLTSLRREHA
jgi:L-seryl-tRNA(Ser) seleniumtransferase